MGMFAFVKIYATSKLEQIPLSFLCGPKLVFSYKNITSKS